MGNRIHLENNERLQCCRIPHKYPQGDKKRKGYRTKLSKLSVNGICGFLWNYCQIILHNEFLLTSLNLKSYSCTIRLHLEENQQG